MPTTPCLPPIRFDLYPHRARQYDAFEPESRLFARAPGAMPEIAESNEVVFSRRAARS